MLTLKTFTYASIHTFPRPIPLTMHKQVVIHNAGLMATPYEPTEDGFEPQMAVNHYAPFLFTALIFPKLRAAGTPSDPARIVNVSSVGHAYSPIRFDDLDFEGGKSYNKWLAYGQSKTAPILFSNEIARRAKEAGVPVVSYSVHPGGEFHRTRMAYVLQRAGREFVLTLLDTLQRLAEPL